MDWGFMRVEEIRRKDGVVVSRVFARGGSFILKKFENMEFLWEIDNYRILGGLGIPTLRVLEYFDEFKARLDALPRTLTYNDFYYTNLIVAKDLTTAFMFDYNMLGKGYVYADIRNVCCQLGVEARAAFLDAYGNFDHEQIVLDGIFCILHSLHEGCKRSEFPAWARADLEKVKSGEFAEMLNRL